VAPPGRVLLSADYGQLELRLMAHFSADAGLVAMLSDPSQDPFTLYASQWLRTPQDQVGVPGGGARRLLAAPRACLGPPSGSACSAAGPALATLAASSQALSVPWP